MLHAWMGVQHTQAVGSNIRHTDMRKKSSNNKPSIDGLSPLLHQQLCVLVELRCRSLSKSAGVTFSNFTWRKMDIPMECRKGGVQTVCTGKGLSVQRDLSIRGPVCSILRVPVYHLLVIALASPLACGRLSPELGSSRLGEMVEEGLEAPLLALGLDLIGLARARLVRASRVPSGSTMIFMAWICFSTLFSSVRIVEISLLVVLRSGISLSELSLLSMSSQFLSLSLNKILILPAVLSTDWRILEDS